MDRGVATPWNSLMDYTITDLTNGSYWLILLNLIIPSHQSIAEIWNGADKIVCTDGAVNKLKDHFIHSCNENLQRGPDYIIGDLDSIKSDSLKWLDEHFGKESYKICRLRDQNTTDFDKSLGLINEIESNATVIALNCFGGRLDHSMAILNSAHRFEKEFSMKIELRNESCLSRIIHAENAEIVYKNFQGANCGILPLFGPVNLDTSGLEWNLEKSQTIQFGGLISTSNRVISDVVSVKNFSNNSYIWTHETK